MTVQPAARRRRRRWLIGLCVLVVLVGTAAGVALWIPSYVEQQVRRAAAHAGQWLGADITIATVELDGLHTVHLHDVRVNMTGAAPAEPPLLSIAEIIVTTEGLSRRPRLTGITLNSPVVVLLRREDGSNNAATIVDRLRGLTPSDKATADNNDGGIWSIIDRHIPTVAVAGGRIEVRDESADRRWLPPWLPSPVAVEGLEGSIESTSALRDRLELATTLDGTLMPVGARGRVVAAYDGAASRVTLEASLQSPLETTYRGIPLRVERAVWHGGETLQVSGVRVGAELTAEAIAVTFNKGFAAIPEGAGMLARLAQVEVTGPRLMLTQQGTLPVWITERLASGDAPGAPREPNPPLGGRPKLDPERGARVRVWFTSLASRLTEALARLERTTALLASRYPSLVVAFHKARILAPGEPDTDSAAFDGSVGRSGDVVALLLERPASKERLALSVDARSGRTTAALAVSRLPLGPLQRWVGSTMAGARLVDTDMHVEITRGGPVTLTGRLNFAGLRIESDAVASAPVDLPTVGVDLAAATFDPTAGVVTVAGGTARMGDVRGAVELGVRDLFEAPVVTWRLDLPSTQLQTIVRAIPSAILGPLESMQLDGTLAWTLSGRVDLRDPQSLDYSSDAKPRDLVVRSLGGIDLGKLTKPFTIAARDADGTPSDLAISPGSSRWVSLGSVSPWMAKVLTTTEDGSFFNHRGISLFSIHDAIAQNLETGHFTRGASTLTQQLVKNVFLSPKKTLARKLQELFVSWRLEKQYSKEKILELYMNVVELGPGIYGVRRAASYYFDKTPKDLDVVECAFIASLLPNPRKFHSQYKRGAVSEVWRQRLEKTLEVMRDRGKLTQDELEAAAPYSPVFRNRKSR